MYLGFLSTLEGRDLTLKIESMPALPLARFAQEVKPTVLTPHSTQALGLPIWFMINIVFSYFMKYIKMHINAQFRFEFLILLLIH
jgi:hypothetical protein